MPIDARARKRGRFISRVHNELQRAIVGSGLKQQQIAEKLGVNRSVVNRQVTGRANLTLGSLADLAWALDVDINVSLDPIKGNGRPLDFSDNKVDIEVKIYEPEPSCSITDGVRERGLETVNV